MTDSKGQVEHELTGSSPGVDRDLIGTGPGPQIEKDTETHNIVSYPNSDTYMSQIGIIIGSCDICLRSSEKVSLKQYEFGEDKEQLVFQDTTVTREENPNYYSIVTCSTCRTLISKVRKMDKYRSAPSKKIYEVAKNLRAVKPIREK